MSSLKYFSIFLIVICFNYIDCGKEANWGSDETPIEEYSFSLNGVKNLKINNNSPYYFKVSETVFIKYENELKDMRAGDFVNLDLEKFNLDKGLTIVYECQGKGILRLILELKKGQQSTLALDVIDEDGDPIDLGPVFEPVYDEKTSTLSLNEKKNDKVLELSRHDRLYEEFLTDKKGNDIKNLKIVNNSPYAFDYSEERSNIKDPEENSIPQVLQPGSEFVLALEMAQTNRRTRFAYVSVQNPTVRLIFELTSKSINTPFYISVGTDVFDQEVSKDVLLEQLPFELNYDEKTGTLELRKKNID